MCWCPLVGHTDRGRDRREQEGECLGTGLLVREKQQGSKPQGNMYKHTRAKLEDNEREREREGGGVKSGS